MIAAASEISIDKWALVVGEWLSEIAYDRIDRETTLSLKSHLNVLCRIEPRLWKSCVLADAALSTVAGMAA
jgi:hypothetical protein